MDIDEFVATIQMAGSLNKCFYHFTDTRNLVGIRANGLLSMRELRLRGIAPPAPGGNDWSWEADRRSGMDGFVHLCLFGEHPMEYLAKKEGRIAQTVFLQINPEVAKLPGVLISDAVANKAGVQPRPAAEMLDEIDLEVIYTRTNWKDADVQARLKSAKRYELLVPDSVPLNRIINLP